MTPEQLSNARVVVAGLGVSGASVARYLGRQGIRFDAVEAGEVPAGLPVGTHVFTDLASAVDTAPDVVVLSPGIPRSDPAVQRAQRAGIPVIGDVELFAGALAARSPSTPVVAVTGSNGKSSVVAWLADALAACGVRAVACGNIGAAALDALDPSVEVYVLELSSYQLESTRSLQPCVASVLNVSEDHLDRYASFEDYAATKRRIYRAAAHRVVNGDDALTQPDDGLGAGDACISLDTPAMPLDAAVVRWTLDDADGGWLCRDATRVLPAAALPVPGRHNVFNALAVLALAEPVLAHLRPHDSKRVGDEVLQAVLQWRGLPHRTRLIADHDGVRWYDDSKGTNVAACVRAIQAMPGPVVLIAGGQGKGADFTPLARCAGALKRAVLIGRDAPLLRSVLAPGVEVVDADSMAEAVALAAQAAVVGDAVLLSPACASFDMFANYQARGEAFLHAVEQQLACAPDRNAGGAA